MNNTSDLLKTQYCNLCSERQILTEECQNLPIGSIQKKKINNREYYYRQYREGKTIKTIFISNDQLADIKKQISRRNKIEKRLKEINVEINQVIKGLGADIHLIPSFEDYSPVKNVDYKDYTMYMSHIAHDIKRLGPEQFFVEYSNVRETGIKARYLNAILDYITKVENSKAYKSANLVLDPLTYSMYYSFGEKDIIKRRLENAIPEFLRQGLLITDIQEAVGYALD